MRRFGEYSTGFCSGWMRVRGERRRRGVDRGFVLSDHADWPALLRTIEETGARRVLATHGHTDTLVRYLREQGIDAAPLRDRVRGESTDAALRRALRGARHDHRDPPQGRGARRLLRRDTGRGRGLGPALPGRRAPAATGRSGDAATLAGRGQPPAGVAGRGDLRSRRRPRRDDRAAGGAGTSPTPGSSAAPADLSLQAWIETRLLPLAALPEPAQREQVVGWWRRCPARECFLVNKLLTGALRVGVSRRACSRARSRSTPGCRAKSCSARLTGDWPPTRGLLDGSSIRASTRRPAIRRTPTRSSSPRRSKARPGSSATARDWLAEWKWDGIRAQLIRRAGQRVALVARRGTGHRALPRDRRRGRTPAELDACSTARCWPGATTARPCPSASCRSASAASARVASCSPTRRRAFLAYDLLEHEGDDLRAAAAGRAARSDWRRCSRHGTAR